MSKYAIEDTTLTGIADAIREKTGKSEKLLPNQMPDEIKNIQTGSTEPTNFVGVSFEQLDSSGYPVIVRTKGLKVLPNNFFRNVNVNNGQYIKTTTIYINEEVSKFNTYPFRECGQLTKLVIESNSLIDLPATTAFYGTPIEDGTGFIYVPDNLVENYKTATNWSTFAAQIKPMSEL